MPSARIWGWVTAAACLVVLVVFPVFELIRELIAAGWGTVSAVFSHEAALQPMVNTLWTSATTTVVTLGLATAFALAAAPLGSRGRTWVMIGMILPLLVPPFVSALGWLAVYGEGGILDDALGLAIPGLVGSGGVVALLVVNALPIAYLIVASSLEARSERDLVRAARVSGASPAQALRTITLPLLGPAYVAAGAIAFIMAANSFGVPAVLGTPARFATTTTRLYRDLTFSADPAAFERVLVLAGFLAVLALVVVGTVDTRSRSRLRLRVEPSGPRPAEGGITSGVVTAITYVAVTSVIPFVGLIGLALTRGVGLAPTPSNWTLENFRQAIDADAGSAFFTSLGLAAVAASLVIGLGALLTALERRRRSGTGSLAAVAFAVPGSVLAVAMLLAYGPWLRDTLLIILLAYVAKFWALGHRPIAGSADSLSPDLTGAARVSGAGGLTVLRTITVPLLRPALVASWLLVFMFGLHELTISSLLHGPGTETLAVVVLDLQQLGDATITAALAVSLTAAAMIVAIPLAWLWRREGAAV